MGHAGTHNLQIRLIFIGVIGVLLGLLSVFLYSRGVQQKLLAAAAEHNKRLGINMCDNSPVKSSSGTVYFVSCGGVY